MSRALFGPAPAILAMKGHQLPTVWSLVGGLLVSVTLCLLLFPIYGITGIAIAYTTANTLVSILQWRLVKHLTGLDSSILNLRHVKLGELLDLRALAPLGRKTQE